jgi:hypothetical protein
MSARIAIALIYAGLIIASSPARGQRDQVTIGQLRGASRFSGRGDCW